MTCLTNFTQRQPSWLLLVCLVGTLELPGCADMSALIGNMNISESEKIGTDEVVTLPAPTPPPSLEEVEEAIASTKTLLDDQQKQVGSLLSLKAEVKQTLREFRDQDLTPMRASIQALQHQVGAWEGATTTNHATVSSALDKLEQDLEQAKTRIGIYGDQVTALIDQIDQNNRQYERLLTEFQDSLVGFKGVMGELKVELKTEKDRATHEEGTLANQLGEHQQTLDHVSLKTQEILVLQKRLNQLHVYINQVRNKVTSDTTALQTALKPEETDNLRALVTSLEDRYQQLTQAPSSHPAFTEHLQALEQRIEQSEKHYAETVNALHESIQEISVVMGAALKPEETDNLRALVTSLENRYQQLTQAPSSHPAFTEHLQALEQRIEQSEKHHTETVKALQHDVQAVSARMMTLAQSVSHLEKTNSPTIPIHAGSITAPQGQQ